MRTARTISAILACWLVAGAEMAWANPGRVGANQVLLPTHEENVKAFGNAASFIHPDLKSLEPVMAGKRAVVYEGACASGLVAHDPTQRMGAKQVIVRVPHRPRNGDSVDLEFMNRFGAAAAAELNDRSEAEALQPEFVRFQYLNKAVKVGHSRLPAAVFPRIVADRLDTWIEDRLPGGKKTTNSAEIGRMAEYFRAAVADMKADQLAHGDLHHRNILITPEGEIRFIDYDGIFTPKLAEAGLNPRQVGLEGFQHPAYVSHSPPLPRPYDANMDHFSSIVIYLSLLALHDNPALWEKHHDERWLVLNEHDLMRPRQSEALREIAHSKNPIVRSLARQLVKFVEGAPEDVPTLDEALKIASESVSAI